MTKYYSATKEFSKVKHIYPFYRFTKAVIRLFFPKTELIWNTPKPETDEPVFFVCNHTKLCAPVYFLISKPPFRVWGNYYFLNFKSCWEHIRKKVLWNLKHPYLMYPIAFLLVPIITHIFKVIESIPVYHHSDKVIHETFAKSIFTLEEGVSQVVFPERTENKVNDYIYEFNQGFPLVAQEYYNKTGKLLKFYPVYCAQTLHKVVVGKPIIFDPNTPQKLQRKQICDYLQNSIQELGDSLPKHKPVLYV